MMPRSHTLARATAWAVLCGFAIAPQVANAACADAPRSGVDWTKCEKRRLILRDSDLVKGRFAGADFGRSDLFGARLVEADLTDASIDHAGLRTADLSRAKMSGVNGYRADFTGAKLVGADLGKAEMARAILRWADLSDANLAKAELQRAVLQGAQMARTNLAGADLARAHLGDGSLPGANLTDADMYLTRVEGVDLSGVTGLSQRQIDAACGNASTKLPAGLSQPASWPCRHFE